MRRALLLAALSCASAAAQGVRITWLGQACFVIQNSDGTGTVITDPPVASVGYSLPPLTANAVTISHNHTDHNNATAVSAGFTLIDGRPVTERQESTVGNLSFVQIPGFHDNQGGATRGRNTIVRWTQAGLRLAHMGDFGQDQFTAEQLADLRDLDVLFFPAGGFFTVEPAAATALVNQLKPRIAIPMHYRTPLGGPAQLAGFPDIASPFGEVRYKPSTAAVSRETLPAATEFWLMEVADDLVAVNAATYSAGTPAAPSSVVALFGDFAGSRIAPADDYPLPRRLGDTEVLIGGAAAPLLYVSPAQINVQVPRRAVPAQVLVEVNVAGRRVARGSLTLLRSAPGLLAALNQDGRANSAANPARRGQVLQLYGTGVVESSPLVEDGAPAPGLPPALLAQAPEILLGGRTVSPHFSALAPGLVGVWRIDFVIPADASTSSAVPLLARQTLTSNTLSVAVQ